MRTKKSDSQKSVEVFFFNRLRAEINVIFTQTNLHFCRSIQITGCQNLVVMFLYLLLNGSNKTFQAQGEILSTIEAPIDRYIFL